MSGRAKVLAGPLDGNLDPFARPRPEFGNALSRRIDADPDSVAQGLAQLVLTIVELLRQLMERQALRRIDGGGLTEEQVERLGRTFRELDRRMEELREQFGLEPEDLNLDLGHAAPLLMKMLGDGQNELEYKNLKIRPRKQPTNRMKTPDPRRSRKCKKSYDPFKR